MANNQILVIVEGPTKAKTIGKMLGNNYNVVASYGHVLELVPKSGAVDPDNNFHMNYQPVEKNKKHLDRILTLAKKSSELVLATDPDREGEAIAWHICEYLRERKTYDHLLVKRSTFHQITKKAILEAISSPKDLNMSLVDAQQARRAMDYLLGFNISPLMWRTIKPGTSAGRVQSPALNLIVSREKERLAFEPREYWSIATSANINKHPITFSLCSINGEKLDKFAITDTNQANKISSEIQSEKSHRIDDVQARTRLRNPKAPFTTSTLQQEASNRIGFPTAKTMKIAQELYEGVKIDNDEVGLITYMRTDSVTIAKEAIAEMHSCIKKTFGDEYLPDELNTYKTKTKNAQEAHEAIRPSHFELIPDQIKKFLSDDQYKLYKLIWSKAVSSQMIPATIDTTTIFLRSGVYLSKATGSVIKHAGFLAAYGDTDEQAASQLPIIEIDTQADLDSVTPNQHFTEPPPRYTEASLVKALEEFGIGRPSTYAAIISTLKKRNYVNLEKKQFSPTDIADVVIKFLNIYFSRYIDYQFTAHMEDSLDSISRGELNKDSLLTEFWSKLDEQVKTIGADVKRSDVTHEELDEKCPECDNPLILKLGRHGKFIGCKQYPECKYTRPLEGEEPTPDEAIDKDCAKCGKGMVKKQSAGGGFYGCSAYPECKYTEPLPENITDASCPKCQNTALIKRRSKRGKVFFGCPDYPKCKYAIWNPPVNQACPACKWPILTEKTLKSGTHLECPECKHKLDNDS